MEKEVELDRIRNRKIFLILTKYIPHLIGVMYIIYTIGEFYEFDMLPLGYMFTLTILPWIYFYSASIALEFCYVHRLPLYYVLADELLLTIDYYFKIPVDVYTLFLIHKVLIGIIICCYTYYYIKRNEIHTIFKQTR